MFLSGSYQCTLSYLNRNISLQISLVYLISFLLAVDVAYGNKANCDLAAHIAVSEVNSVCFTFSFFCHLNFP